MGKVLWEDLAAQNAVRECKKCNDVVVKVYFLNAWLEGNENNRFEHRNDTVRSRSFLKRII